MQCKVFEELAAAFLVCISKRGPRDVAPKACVIKLGSLAVQTSNDVAQARTRGQLSKHHAQKLIPVRKRKRGIATGVASNKGEENGSREMLAELSEHEFALAHSCLPKGRQFEGNAKWNSNRFGQKIEKYI